MPCWSNQASDWLSWSLVTICEAAETAMNAGSGEIEIGGDSRPVWFATEGMSLEILGDLVVRGEGYPESNRGVCVPGSDGAIAICRRKVQPSCASSMSHACSQTLPRARSSDGEMAIRKKSGRLN